MDSDDFKKAMTAAAEEIVQYKETIATRPVRSRVAPGYLKELLPTRAPEEGEEWKEIQRDIELKILPGMNHWNSPRFMAWFPAPTSYPSMLGELYSSAFSVSAFNWECAPVVTELEIVVMDWLAQALNLPPCYLSSGQGGGVIQGTTSEAVLATMVAARERILRKKTDHLIGQNKEEAVMWYRARLVALGSEASHTCTQKAAMIAGVRYQPVPVSIDDDFSMRGSMLLRTLESCKKAGLEPFFLTATLGTTSTCAVDKFDEIAELLEGDNDIWVHIDAAYAGSALICEEYQYLTENFEFFDSFSMTMSKWLLTNLDACCLFVRNRRDLTDALAIDAAYLRNNSDIQEITDFRHWQVPLSRRFRALKVWFVMRTYGMSGLRAYIRNHISLGNLFASLIISRADLFKIVAQPAFALTVFQAVPPMTETGWVAKANSLTKALYENTHRTGEIMLTSTMIGGIYAIRVVCANPSTEEKYIRLAFYVLVETAERILRREEQDSPNARL